MSRLQKIIVLLVAVLIGAGIIYAYLPKIWAKAAPAYLMTHIENLTVRDAVFFYAPPRLVLKDVHLTNPPQFGPGNAIKIGQIEVLFAGYSYSPLRIQSVTAQDIKGRLVIRGADDNFATLFNQLMAKKQEVALDEMARPARLDRVLVRHVTIQNEDGSVLLPMEDTAFQPIDSLSKTVSLQHVIVDVLGAIVGQQSQAGPALVVQGVTNKAVDTVKAIGKSIGKAFQDYMNAP